MEFRRLDLTYNNQHKVFDLKKKTLIYSGNNSVGKSTLLRLLFYGLGYSIPGTLGLKFKNMEVKVFFTNQNGKYHTKRTGDHIELLSETNYITSRDLPIHENSWFTYIWNIESSRVLDNVLGAMYMDQDKGWTLLNRGKVIGNIRFNVRDLLIGLYDDDDKLNDELILLERQKNTLKQTRQILSIFNSSQSYGEDLGIAKNSNEEALKEYNNLVVKKKILQNNFKKLNRNIKEQNGLKNYIDSLNIMIRFKGKYITVTKENIANFNENIDYLKQKAAWTHENMQVIANKISLIKSKLSQDTENLFTGPDVVTRTLQDISRMPINTAELSSRIQELERSTKVLNKSIENDFISENKLISETRNWILLFAKKLGVDKIVKERKYIFTRDLKSISGTIYYKIVFSFKMAYLKIIEEYTGITLPIILDSPSGREVTNRNISAIIDILNNHFAKNQIIIASIHEYNLNNVKKIEIKDHIFENQ